LGPVGRMLNMSVLFAGSCKFSGHSRWSIFYSTPTALYSPQIFPSPPSSIHGVSLIHLAGLVCHYSEKWLMICFYENLLHILNFSPDSLMFPEELNPSPCFLSSRNLSFCAFFGQISSSSDPTPQVSVLS
jgi:hypothetical protein